MAKTKNRQPVRKGESGMALAMRTLIRDKFFIFGLGLFIILVLMAVFAEQLSPYPWDQINIDDAYMTPCWEHPFGCDELGRDILSRLMYGGRYSLTMGLGATALAATVGIFIGAMAGYYGGMVDNIIMRVLDVFQAMPGTLFAIVISAVLGNGLDKTILALGISSVSGMARLMRASMLNVREQEFVEASRSINCSSSRIIWKHVFPNSMQPMIVSICNSMSTTILAATGLSYIGLGVQPPNPEWGAMLTAGRNYLMNYPHLALMPGIFIMLAVLSFNTMGDALRDALDPKLKK